MDVSRQANQFLIVSGILNASAAILHLACIYYGAPWYRFFGAGEEMAVLAEQGSNYPTFITLVIFSVLSIWSLYCFSAAGLIHKFPLTKLVLIFITVIYFSRGFVGFAFITKPLGRSPEFWFWSSVICIIFGICHALGIIKTE
jgi:hypothetical protein